jgi:hypothetical protein
VAALAIFEDNYQAVELLPVITQVLAIAAYGAHQMTWCRIQKSRTHSGGLSGSWSHHPWQITSKAAVVSQGQRLRKRSTSIKIIMFSVLGHAQTLFATGKAAWSFAVKMAALRVLTELSTLHAELRDRCLGAVMTMVRRSKRSG